MPDQQQLKSAVTADDQKVRAGAPYESTLLRAFDKLTSEVFVFLLAYVILLIGLAWFVPAFSIELRILLYILPVLGIAAYVWLQSGRITKEAEEHGVQVWSGVAAGSAYVAGVRGGLAALLGRVKVFSGIATGRARVIGVDAGSESLESEGAQEGYLLETFRKLDESNRRKVVNEASRLLDRRS
jgi:hypothetical protein